MNRLGILCFALLTAPFLRADAQRRDIDPAATFAQVHWHMQPAAVRTTLETAGLAFVGPLACARDTVPHFRGMLFGDSVVVIPAYYHLAGGLRELDVQFHVDSSSYDDVFKRVQDSLVARHGPPHAARSLDSAKKTIGAPDAHWGRMDKTYLQLVGAWRGRPPRVSFSYRGPDYNYIASRAREDSIERANRPPDRVHEIWEVMQAPRLLRCTEPAVDRFFQDSASAEFVVSKFGRVMPGVRVTPSAAAFAVEGHIVSCIFSPAYIREHPVDVRLRTKVWVKRERR